MADETTRDQEESWWERLELQERIHDWFDGPLTLLGFVMLGLLLIELTVDLSAKNYARVTRAETLIWAIFLVVFFVEFALAPNKLTYLKKHWFTAISVALPALRVVRIVRVVQALRGLSLVRILTTLNRGARGLGTIARRGQFQYIVLLTLVVTLTAAAGTFYFERGAPGADITSVGNALWWAFTLVTTINSNFQPVTVEARLIGLLLRVFALAASGYITATIAVHLLGGGVGEALPPEEAEIRDLRNEIAELRRLLESRNAREQGAAVEDN